MRKIIVVPALLLCLFLSACKGYREQIKQMLYNHSVLKEDSSKVAEQYGALQTASSAFLSYPAQEFFMQGVAIYLQNGDNDLSTEKASKMKIIMPMLTDKSRTKAMILAFDRSVDMAGKRVDYIRFISARHTDGKWQFGFNKGHSFSVYYADDAMPLLAEQELAKEAIRNFMLMGNYKDNSLNAEKLFESGFYVL